MCVGRVEAKRKEGGERGTLKKQALWSSLRSHWQKLSVGDWTVGTRGRTSHPGKPARSTLVDYACITRASSGRQCATAGGTSPAQGIRPLSPSAFIHPTSDSLQGPLLAFCPRVDAATTGHGC